MAEIKVKIIYRNYIPLYSGYCSFWLDDIPGVEVIIPEVKTHLKKFYKWYLLCKKIPLVKGLLNLGQNLLFNERKDKEDIDLYFFAGIMPDKNFGKPFILDLEHVYQLFNFVNVTASRKKDVFKILESKNCKRILPWSIAAENTLKKMYKDEYTRIMNKVEVLYPALPLYKKVYKGKADHSIVRKDDKKIKILFVGRDIYRKGLMEALIALKEINKKFSKKIEFYCVSGDTEKLKNQFQSNNFHFYPFNFPHDEVIKKFFMTCDLFVMPTRVDTFGMVYLEALSCGMPIIATKQFAIPEFLKDGENGFFVESDNLFLHKKLIPTGKYSGIGYRGIEKKLVIDLTRKLNLIIENPNVLRSLKIEAPKEFEPGGKFSIIKRNKILERMIRTSIKDGEDKI
ncbi:glycosyltransferase family 4 protein [Candidatus Dojkabacteria bacterium]|nr:glycosyltransferase family 4 protein [Candidatus Dojkabacteria bacterium]